MSRAWIGSSHSEHTTLAVMSWPQAVWRSTIGGPASPESHRSPQAIMAARTG